MIKKEIETITEEVSLQPPVAVAAPTTTGYSLNVVGLSYIPPKSVIHNVNESISSLISKQLSGRYSRYINRYLPKVDSKPPSSSALHNITFEAKEGEVTAILGPDRRERRTLINLLASRCFAGEIEGQISMNGVKDTSKSYAKNCAFIPRNSLYIPGLTFYEMVRFSALLRLTTPTSASIKSWNDIVEDRVQEVLDIMDLTACQKNKIEEYPIMRGQRGSEIRRLSIATEIINLTPLILLEDPHLNLELAVSLKIYERLKILAKKGHAIVCTMEKPPSNIINILDKVVILSEGRTIFSSSPRMIERYFTSKELGYIRKKDVDIVDFVLDIASGTERSIARRTADSPLFLQEKFETSDIFTTPLHSSKSADQMVMFLPSTGVRFFGYKLDTPQLLLYRTYIVTQRAVYVKLRDFEVIKKTIGSSILVGLVVGYLQYNQGNYGIYTMTITKLPYPQTSNLTALLFFVSIFIFVQQALNVHVICQKFQQFRLEQEAKCCPTISFLAATLVSEAPFTVIACIIFSLFTFFLVQLHPGVDNVVFYSSVLVMIGLVGLSTAIMLTAIFKYEFVVRDIYLVCSFLMVLLSGFPFQLPNITWYMAEISAINPIRWTYEALMNWNFSFYEDGFYYIQQFSFNNFQHYHIYTILVNFIAISVAISIIALLPQPNLLKRKPLKVTNPSRSSRDSEDAFDVTKSVGPRVSEMIKPLLFAREASTVSKSALSVSISIQGEAYNRHGHTVKFNSISYSIKKDLKKNHQHTVLNNLSGQFDWGKLGMIMGAHESGKTSLLRILAGEKGIVGSTLSGSITFDDKSIDPKLPLWERCGLVECGDDFYRDLTVRDVLRYGMMLRCSNKLGFKLIDENIQRTIDILRLEDVKFKKTKLLTAGERRRLSIGEEIVFGPALLLIDEPTTNLDAHDESVMLSVFREMVNQDKTVIATMYQPSANVYGLFDTLLLLCHGRIIYQGPAADAVAFFVNSPYKFSYAKYNNPGDFLTDISSGVMVDHNGNHVSPIDLERHYQMHSISSRYTASSSSGSNSTFNPSHISGSNKTLSNQSQGDLPTIASPSASSSQRIEALMGDDGNATISTATQSYYLMSAVREALVLYITHINVEEVQRAWFKIEILLYRSTTALANRKKLILGTLLLHIALAVILGWIMGPSRGQIYNLTSFFAVSALLLMISNIQLVYYMHSSHRIFLKENARHLYSNFCNWSVCSLPLTLLKFTNAFVFAMISSKMIQLEDDTAVQGFFFFSIAVTVITAFNLAECIINLAPDKRTAYTLIPASAFFHFTFSGLFVKYSTLPMWLSTWMPSVSIIRWAMQGEFLNQFATEVCVIQLPDTSVDGCTFPTIIGPGVSYDSYNALLHVFGWGGKSKWYCLSIIVVWMIVYRFLALAASGMSTIGHRRHIRSTKSD